MKHEKIDPAAARRALLERMLAGKASGAAAISEPEPIGRREPARPVPLTREQNQLWIHAEMAPEMPLYNESITIRRLGPYNHQAMERALTELVRRHEIWRTRFVEAQGELTQVVEPPIELKLPLLDISHLPEHLRDGEAVRLATEDARAPIPFDLAPLFRARVVKLSDDEHRLYLTLHHIIFDGVSIYRTVVPELAALVAAFERGQASPLAEPELQYADYARWQADQDDPAALKFQLDHWRTALAEPLPRLELAGDHPRPVYPTHAGSMEVFDLAGPLVERLKTLAMTEGATLYMVLLAAYKAMLFRYTGDTDIIVGGVTDTRRRPELQPMIGYFLNTMALRSRPEGGLGFRDYLAQVKRSVIGALGAADIPFDRVVRDLQIKRGPGTHPLFNTLFSIEPPVDPFPEGWDLTQMDVVVGAAKYDLYLELDERPDGMVGRLLYSTELFEAGTIRRMIGHWRRMLEGIAAEPATPLVRLPMLSDDERGEIVRWNATGQPLPHATVVDWFAARANDMPGEVAIDHEGERWTYAELARRSDAIAVHLAKEGVRAGDLVGLALSRSPWIVAAMLGVAKTGAAYLPLDPGFPAARLKMIVEDAEPKVVLAEHDTEGSLPAGAARMLRLEREWPEASFEPQAVDAEALAYVLYTSGSTGRPKGVEIPHAALVNLLAAMQETPGFARGETLLAITTLSFDIAELELWLPLVSGGTVLLASRETAVDMAALAELIGERKPAVMQATPATWRGLLESGWDGAPWMRALCGGEALPRALADELGPKVKELWNVYGPTETTIWSTAARVESGAGLVPIGKPIWNTQVRVLDGFGGDLPIGAVGELHIGGRGLAAGYRGRPDLTAAKFIEHGGERLYRTGDLARWRADGVIECFGRTDSEEKIRGFRIAIEEVEGALVRFPGVGAAAVRAWPDASGERALAAYLVGEGRPSEWRTQLAELLPDYMIPSHFVVLDELPMTPNGKVDRKALPQPGAPTRRAAEGPATPNEERLAAIWRDVLNVDRVFRDDDFFDLGGHSLLIARLLRRIEKDYGARVPMAALFRAPRLADMAELIFSGRAIESPALIPIQPGGTQPPILWLDGGSTFLPLAEKLGRDQPFLGISIDVLLEEAGGCPERLEQVAELVIQAIRQVQPRGPYRIGGWCTSGILAFAVAVQLRQQCEEVSLLALLHAFHPVKARQTGAVRIFLSKFRFHLGVSVKQPAGHRLSYFCQRLRGLSDAAALAGGHEAVLQPALRSALDKIALSYDPPRYAGDLLLIQPDERADVLDFAKEWRETTAGEFVFHTVPGGHRTMLEPPHVTDLARILEDGLKARADERKLGATG